MKNVFSGIFCTDLQSVTVETYSIHIVTRRRCNRFISGASDYDYSASRILHFGGSDKV